MKLYNSETKKIEELIPNEAGKIKMYTCGPTVYSYAHIGNFRAYIMEDALFNALTFLGYKVERVMNITDVGHLSDDNDYGEDKLLRAATKEHKSVLDIAKFYTDAFKKDFDKLKLSPPMVLKPATECVDTYIEIITKLLEKGFAYKSEGNVYFDTSKLKQYFRFGNQDGKDNLVGVREGVDEDKSKRNQNDFALWFTKSKFEDQALKWDSPWGVGYPGWHIECSGISYKYLGEYLDIHCGAIDNQFPHHTNEIAQSESFFGHKWCSTWFHVGFLNAHDGTKMSKSLGNLYTISQLEEKGFSPMVYKFFNLQTYYRNAVNFSLETLDLAKAAYNKLLKRIANLSNTKVAIDKAMYEKFYKQFADALNNDLNTSLAVTTVFDVLKAETSDSTKVKLILEFDKFFHLGFTEVIENGLVEDEFDEETKKFVEEQIALRLTAKKNRDFALADKIRNELSSKGIELVDTPTGTTYHKK